ncbi:MAG: OmpH family outer membrane protein [Muribaculaceae bacterium]|nr:OmpH family outer membrane protein [Muribaculaceae bacterium]
MNYRNYWAKIALACVVVLAIAACNNEKTPKAAAPSSASSNAKPGLVIRYIDEDSVIEKYNLAKDFQESMLRRQNELDQTTKKKSDQITNFGASMEQKYKNNQYLSQDAFNADQNKLQQMQANAQNELGQMQQSLQKEFEQNSKELQDSITTFLNSYAKEMGFDVILRKSSTLYIDPQYDITDDVIEQLNKRYTKVAPKKK